MNINNREKKGIKTLYENFPHQEVIRIFHKLVQFSLMVDVNNKRDTKISQ